MVVVQEQVRAALDRSTPGSVRAISGAPGRDTSADCSPHLYPLLTRNVR